MREYEKYFKGKEERLKKLEELHEKKKMLKEYINNSNESYVVEFCGLPRTGKTNATQRVFSFFKYGGIDIKIAEEPAYLVKNSVSNEKLKQMSKLDFNDKTLEISINNLQELKQGNSSIILMDRGVIDNYFWYQMMYQDNIINKEIYDERMKNLYFDLNKINKLYVFLADPETIIHRDYLNEIYLDARTKTTLEGVRKLKKGYESLYPEIVYMNNGKNVEKIETTNIDEIDTSIMIADSIMDDLQKKLILK